MKYSVELSVSAFYIAEVEAESLEDAREKARTNFEEADCGDLCVAEEYVNTIEVLGC